MFEDIVDIDRTEVRDIEMRPYLLSSWSYFADSIFTKDLVQSITTRVRDIINDENDDTIDKSKLSSYSEEMSSADIRKKVASVLRGVNLSYSDRAVLRKLEDLFSYTLFLSSSDIAMSICILLAIKDDRDLDQLDRFLILVYFNIMATGRVSGARKIDVHLASKGISLIQSIVGESDILKRIKSTQCSSLMEARNALSFKGRIDEAFEKHHLLIEDGVSDQLALFIALDVTATHTPGLYWTAYDVDRNGGFGSAIEWYKSSWSGNATAKWKSAGYSLDEANDAYDKYGVTNPKELEVVNSTASSWVQSWG